ncbi:MAG: hypothetical protein DRO14_05630 [Thermoprotei archaeon]|nr:MAG: hypothetical protein DRO14_05630 [Thermoprotei archaeon]
MKGDYTFGLSQSIPTLGGMMFKVGEKLYELIYPKLLVDDITWLNCKYIAKREIDFSTSPPTIGSEELFDIESASGISNPVVPHRTFMGYDADNDAILMFVSNKSGNTGSKAFAGSTVKLLSIKRDFSSYTIEINDVISLAKTAYSGIDKILMFAHAWRIGGLGVAAVGTYAGSSEVSIILKDTGSGWVAERHNERYDFIQERVEPIWDGSTFLGFLTEGHGTNSLWVKTDGSVQAGAPGGLFTTEPVYDPINNQVIWIEWGSGTGATQHIWTAPPSDPFNATDKTPSGTLTDNEGNSIDLATCNKANGHILSDPFGSKLLMYIYRGGLPEKVGRILAVDLSISNPELVYDPNGSDKIQINGILRCFDLTANKLAPVPLIIAEVLET